MAEFLLATPDGKWPKRVGRVLERGYADTVQVVDGDSLDVAGVLKALHETNAPVLVVGPSIEGDAALALADAVTSRRRDVAVIVIAESSPKFFQDAARSGAKDVVSPTASDGVLRGALGAALETALRARATLRASAEAGHVAKVITVVSPKGGSGKTAIATNVAVGLANVAPNDVVLVDLDVQFGDVAQALGLAPGRTLAALAGVGAQVSAQTVRSALTTHRSGLSVLCAPDSPAVADVLTPQVLGRAIEVLATMFRYVVIDTGARIDEPMLAAVQRSTDLVLVCATDVASALALRKVVDMLDALQLTTPTRHFVLNRADARVGITVEDIEAATGLGVAVAVDSDRAIPTAMNEASPLLESHPGRPAARGFHQLVRRFAPYESARRKAGWVRAFA